jgi:putative DNA primase/helicase
MSISFANPSALLVQEYQERSFSLSPQHYQELIGKRGLPADWVLANCRSINTEEASELLGYLAQSAGVWLQGVGSQGQFKPDKPWKSEGQKKAPKYRTPTKESFDAILPSHPENKRYWHDLEALKERCWKIDGHPYIIISEGTFKAISGCAHEHPTIGLLGVEMGLTSAKADPQGKRYLVPTLEKYVRAGFGFIIAFDADCATKRDVIEAERKLTFRLKQFDVPVRSITGMWTADRGKGMDDYIQANGIEEFRAMLCRAEERRWSTSEDSEGETKKLPPADAIARSIAEEYRDQLAFNNETGQWMRYGADQPGMWSVETDEFIESIISTILDSREITYGSHSYVVNIVKKLRCILIERKWAEYSPKEILPFRNGVLEIASGKLLPHSPGYKLTWQLPREHNALANNWDTIDGYLNHLSGGNAALKEIYLCFCNAVLKGRADLQKFLHMIGVGGSGKGTFARLITALIGEENILSTTLEDWCGNRFESANAYRKRLVVFWDEDKQAGNIGKFLSLTGGDWIRAEEKGRKGFQYRYDGMTLVLSNTPIFTGSAASRIKRRVITSPCNNPVPAFQVRDIEEEFKLELDAFTNHILSIPDNHVTAVLRGLTDVPECTLEFWENRMRVDSIASWLNDRVIYDPLAKTQIGSNKDEALDGTPVTLYGSYCQYARQSGTGIKSHRNFSPDLTELCRSVLGWEVEHKATKTGKFILGLRLRTALDSEIPTHDFTLMERVTDGDGLGDGLGDGSGCPQDKGFEEGDGLTPIPSEKIADEFEQLEIKIKADFQEEVTVHPSPPPEALLDKACEPSPASVTQSVTSEVSDTERSQISRCLGAIEAVLWQDDFSALIKKQKLSDFRQQYGAATYNAACDNLSAEDKADLEALRQSSLRTSGSPYSSKNLPKKGDRLRTVYGTEGKVTVVRATNPRYEVSWDNGRVMGYELADLEALEARKI